MNLQPLNKGILNYSDSNYSKAVNYSISLYNFPITLNFGEKHNRTKYIIAAGNYDHISIYQDGVYIYILTINTGLNYISLEVFNTETKEEDGNIFLSDSEADEVLEMEEKEQIKYLLQYID